MDPEHAAREAIEGGTLLEHRHDVERGESAAVAVDVQTDVAAAYVVTYLPDGLWQTDVVAFARVGTIWEWRAEGGSGGPDLPLERSDDVHGEGLEAVDTSMTEDGDHWFVAVGGFATATVALVELAVRDATRRVEPNPHTGAFVAAVVLRAGPGLDRAEIDVRAIDRSGAVVDSTAAWHAERAARMPDTVTVAEASELPDGTRVTVQAKLLVIEHQPVRLCDQIDLGREPPEPKGASLIAGGLSATDMPLSWTTPGMGVSTSIVVMSGTVQAGALEPGP